MGGTISVILFLVSLIWPLKLVWDRYARQREIAASRWIASFSTLALINIGWQLFRAIGIKFYIENLWFHEVEQAAIFWKRIGMPWLVGITGFALALVIVSLSLRSFSSVATKVRTATNDLKLEYQSEKEIARGIEIGALFLQWSTKVVALVIAFFVGLAASGHWLNVLLFLNRVPTGTTDPLFGKDIVFYFFALPVWNTILTYILVLSALLTALTYLYGYVTNALVNGAAEVSPTIRELVFPILDTLPRRTRREAAFFGFVFLTSYAFSIYLARYGLLTKIGSIFSGPHYVDIVAGIRILTFEAVVLTALAFLILFDGFRPFVRNFLFDDPTTPGWQPRKKALVTLGAIALLFGGIKIGWPWYLSKIISQGNAIQIETPYMARNIEATRRAFGIIPGIQMDEKEYVPDLFSRSVLNADSETLQNIRVADWRALHPALNQEQLLRKYYTFSDVDIDRYEIHGTSRQVMLSVREINLGGLPDAAKTWVNQHFIYTHGYCLAVVPVNSFTNEGLPDFLVKDMPCKNISGAPALNVTKPQIYYGENTVTYAYTRTGQPELDYPAGDDNVYTKYDGNGGIRISNAFRRFVLALEFDGWRMYVSPLLTNDTRLMYRRAITERISHITPFLALDGDPYPVIADGRIFWIVDAYTTTNRYPYSTSYTFWDSQARNADGKPSKNHGVVNYVRNSVKIVVDAYNGTIDFYLMDQTDPLVQAYSRIFPTLFKSSDTMPTSIRNHLRYPEDLLYLQSRVLTTYHMSKPNTFYNREDEWLIGREKISVEKGQDSTEVIPYFITMSLPDEQRREFVLMQPFTPAKRNNLSAWIAGRADWPNYGKLVLLKFPKGVLTSGPLQAELRIDTEAEISEKITLWNKEGSEVIRGNLLIIPYAKSLLYVEPIYLRSSGENTMPKLIRVIVGAHLHEGQQELTLAWAPTFREALEKLVAGARVTPPTPEQEEPQKPQNEPQIVKDLQELLAKIRKFCAKNPSAEICQK
ncbi:MAG: UPF0182 family protein [Parcubacteria group bacterium]|nr:UPF0182 family protein [Parcubacteria group bacterium]